MERIKDTWKEQGIAGELGFWRRVMEGIIGNQTTVPPRVISRMKSRLLPDRKLQDYPCFLLKETGTDTTNTIRILDAGAGPFTQLGSAWPGHKVEVTAVDALASQYDELLAEYNLVPPVRTVSCDFELLDSYFGENRFDLVWTQNALDHSYNPVLGIENLIKVARPNAYISIMLFENEAERERYSGMHQWNFSNLEDDIFISERNGKGHLLSQIIKDKADLITIRNVTYFNDEDTGGIETLTKEQVNDIKSQFKNAFIWMQFLLKKNT